MKTSEVHLKNNIKLLYLKILEKHPDTTRAEIPLILIKELNITDENIITAVKANCILAGYDLLTEGYVKKENNHSFYKSIATLSLTDKGIKYLNKIKKDDRE